MVNFVICSAVMENQFLSHNYLGIIESSLNKYFDIRIIFRSKYQNWNTASFKLIFFILLSKKFFPIQKITAKQML